MGKQREGMERKRREKGRVGNEIRRYDRNAIAERYEHNYVYVGMEKN